MDKEGHIYCVEPFSFKNGEPPKTKFFVPLSTHPDGAVTGILVSSRDHGRIPDTRTAGPVAGADGSPQAYVLPYGHAIGDTGFRFAKPTFAFFNQVLTYSRTQIEAIRQGATYVRDWGRMDEALFQDLRRSFLESRSAKRDVQDAVRRSVEVGAKASEKRPLRMRRSDDDRLSEIGVPAAKKAELRRCGVLVHEAADMPDGRVILVLQDSGAVVAMTAEGETIGPLSDLQRMMRGERVSDDGRFPPGTLKPYLQKESAIKWLADHLGGDTAVDRKTMYHLNIIDSLIQHDKEIYKRIPSDYLGGLPEGGRRNVAASALLRAEGSTDAREPSEIRPSGYTREQELIGNWAERDGCWSDYAEAALRRAGHREADFGSEARVFTDDDRWVYKTIDLSHYGSLEKMLDRISLHNAVFPETAMEVLGFGMRDDAEDSSGYVVTVRQPFVKGACPDGPEGLKTTEEQLAQRGFRLARPVATPQEKAQAAAAGLPVPQYANTLWCFLPEDRSVQLYDIHDQNFVISEEGRALVFDCEIKLNDDPHLGETYRIPPVEYDADAVRKIGALLEELVPKAVDRHSFTEMYGTEKNRLAEQLQATGRYDGLIEGPFPGDRWLVAVNPENRDEVLVLPQKSAALMLSILPDGAHTMEEKTALAAGRCITARNGRTFAFNLDRGRVCGAKSWLRIRQALADRQGRAEKPAGPATSPGREHKR